MLANITWSWAKVIDHICLYLTLIHKSKVTLKVKALIKD